MSKIFGEYLAFVAVVLFLLAATKDILTMPTVAIGLDGKCKWVETELGREACTGVLPSRHNTIRVR